MPSGMIVLPSGSSIIVGFASMSFIGPLPSNIGWLWKTDGNGCWEAPCTIGTTEAPAAESGVWVYPNPSTGWFELQFPEPTEAGVLRVVDAQGRVLHTQAIPASQSTLQLDASSWPNGLYYLQGLGESGVGWQGRVVVQR
jgi:Secretion system C-terminal sorting domain